MTNGMDTSEAGPASRNGPPRLQAIALLINAAGAVLVVVLALLAVFWICFFLVGDVDSGDRGSVVTSAFTVIGTIVGAYTGVKIGSSGREEAERARDVESAKVETLAARVDSRGGPKLWTKSLIASSSGAHTLAPVAGEVEANRERPPGPSRPAP